MHFTPPVQQVIQSRDDQRDENNFTVASFSMAIQKYPQENRRREKNADFNPLTMDSSDTRMFVLNWASRKPNRSIIFTINFFVSLRQFI